MPRLTRAAFLELGTVRAVLEPLAVRLAAMRMGRKTLASLAASVRAEQDARTAGNADAILQCDRQFLMTIYAAAEAPLLFGMIEATWLRRGPRFSDARWLITSRPPGMVQHADMLAHLQAKDGPAAAELLKLEIEAATDFLLKHMAFAGDPPAQAGLRAVRTLGKIMPSRR